MASQAIAPAIAECESQNGPLRHTRSGVSLQVNRTPSQTASQNHRNCLSQNGTFPQVNRTASQKSILRTYGRTY